MDTVVIVAIISLGGLVFGGVLTYFREIKIKKMEKDLEERKLEAEERLVEQQEKMLKLGALDRLLDFTSFNEIRDSVDRMFAHTKADRFMIIIAMNGKTDFRVISVIFEQHKTEKWKVNAIIRYRDVEIDEEFKKMLKAVESEGEITYDVNDMRPQLLKNFYVIEKIKHSKLRFLHREKLDKHNDVVIYSTIATHEDLPFTQIENTIIKTEYEGSIIHTIKTYV